MATAGLTACAFGTNEPTTQPATTQPAETMSGSDETAAPSAVADYSIVFDGNKYTVSDASSVTVEGNALVLTKGGASYEISGTMTDGQIQVKVSKEEEVDLYLNNFTGSCSTSAVIYVVSADKCTVHLEEGTTSTLTDAATYHYPDANTTKPNACLYSSEDLTIKGSGSLVVNGNYDNGIGCKNDLKIKNGNITVNAVNNAVKGNDSVTVEDGILTVTGAEDGIKSDSETAGKGFVSILGGKISITCNDDGIQALQAITVSGGTVTVKCGDKPVNCDGTVNITEGCLTYQ